MGCCQAKSEDAAPNRRPTERWAADTCVGVVPGDVAHESLASEQGNSAVSVQPAMFSTGYVIREPDTDKMRDRILAKALKSTLELSDDDDDGEDAFSDASSTSGAAVDQRMPLPVKTKDLRSQRLRHTPNSGLTSSGLSTSLPGQIPTASAASSGPSSLPSGTLTASFRGKEAPSQGQVAEDEPHRADAKEELWRASVAKRGVPDRVLPYAKPPEGSDLDAESIATTGAGSYRRQPGPHTLEWITREASLVVEGRRRPLSPPIDIFQDLETLDETSTEPADISSENPSIPPSNTVSTSTVRSGLSAEVEANAAFDERLS